MTAVECTPNISYGKTPTRMMNRSSDYSRGNVIHKQNPESRRKTAAERLEADKLKYVKSSKARQRRFTLELHSTSPHNDSTGTHSMGTASTGSPINMDEDDVSDYTGCDVTNDISKDSIHRSHSNGTFYSGIHAVHKTVVRSSTDNDFSNRLKVLSTPTQSPKVSVSSHAGGTVDNQARNKPNSRKDLSQGQFQEPVPSSSPKDSRRGKSLSNYLNKAKEGIKAVTSTIAGATSNEETDSRSRQSRSATSSKSSKVRSASVGASVYRTREHAPNRGTDPQKLNVNKTVSDNPVMSPRSQLKHARQNLKKVNSMPKYSTKNFTTKTAVQDENRTTFLSPSARPKSNTFTVIPNQTKSEREKDLNRHSDNVQDSKQNTSYEKPTPSNKPAHLKTRPLSVIENRDTRNSLVYNIHSSVKSDYEGRGVVRRRSSSTKDEDQDEGNDVDLSSPTQKRTGIRRVSSQRFKRRSWDLAHTMDTSLQLAMDKQNAPTSLTPDPDMVLASPFSNLPKQRKSWSRVPPTTDNRRLQSSRTSYHEEMNKPGARKSITEALEEIFNPLEQDEGITLNNTSPDATAEANTLVGQETNNTSHTENSVADNINNLLRGADAIGEMEYENLSRSKTPESSRSKTPTGDQNMDCFGGNDVDIGLGNVKYYTTSSSHARSKSSANSSPDSLHRRHSSYREDGHKIHDHKYSESRQWTNYTENQGTASQPLNRIDLAPAADHQTAGGSSSSPMLAPRSRREVAPDCGMRSNTNSLSRNGPSTDEHVNTMRSQNTTSSASADVTKPFTALTANDLKPRRAKHGYVNPVAPLKPTLPYAMQPPSSRGNSKRHTNAPVSPTISPHKQQARMTPPHSSRSTSSTPYSSLKRTPTSSRSSSLKRNRQRSKSDVSLVQTELDKFFSTMGMGEYIMSPLPNSTDTLFTTAHVSSESDFSFAGASAYVRDGPDETVPMDIDPMTASLSQVPAVSIIEKNARIMRWLVACKKSNPVVQSSSNNPPRSPRMPVSVPHKDSIMSSSHRKNSSPNLPSRHAVRTYGVEPTHHKVHTRTQHGMNARHHTPHQPWTTSPPPIPPRVGLPKESDV
uniref:Uncharacterized protein LOC100186681 n=1 Tax=Phallusia mammillata TaxID=59560 RepID=A0A6F9DJ18_9ASCI|nr:uncharacterized protein LOC100186681 [Phallusia mammillata]